jgi:hypothetical protein
MIRCAIDAVFDGGSCKRPKTAFLTVSSSNLRVDLVERANSTAAPPNQTYAVHAPKCACSILRGIHNRAAAQTTAARQYDHRPVVVG